MTKGKSDSGLVKKGPRFGWRGQGDSHAARATGWYPAPARIPNSGRWNWFHDEFARGYSREGGNGLAVPEPRKGRGSQASTPGGNVVNPTYN